MALVLVAPCVLAWRPPPDADPLKLPRSRSLGRALSMWSHGLQPPPVPALLGVGARRTLHKRDDRSELAPPHLHSVTLMLSMADSGSMCLDSFELKPLAAGEADSPEAGGSGGRRVHWDAPSAPGLRRRSLAEVAEEAAAVGGTSPVPASGSSGQQAKPSRRHALAHAAVALAQAALVASARVALIAAEPLLVLLLRAVVRSRR